MARSRSRRPASDLHVSLPDAPRPATPSLAAATLPRVWEGIGYRPLPDPAAARGLFDYAAATWPADVAFAWGAFTAGTHGEELAGGLAAERTGRDVLLHGPVVRTEGPAPADPLVVAAQLVAAGLDHAVALGAVTVFARPQGLDRVWVRFGFIPVPEVTLPAALAGRPGVGLYAWRGGSALWALRDAANA